LHPPQNLALLFQVVDGTANPLAAKPEHHIADLPRGSNVAPFAADAVADGTDGCRPGHRHARCPERCLDRAHLLPSGVHWIWPAVTGE
jgi:hypothetical protein